MSGIGGSVRGMTCVKMAEQMCYVGQYISQKACLFGAPFPVVGTEGTKTYVGVCDGEIVNRDALHKELQAKGFRFGDRSSAVVALHAYMAWGAACVERFVGTFALAVWDGEQLFLARDRLGYKPLYYYASAQGLVFASHMKTMLRHNEIKPTLTRDGIEALFLLAPARAPGYGILKGINELKAGHYILYKGETPPEMHCYWQIKAFPHRLDAKQSAHTLRGLLADVTPTRVKETEEFAPHFFGTDELAEALESATLAIGMPNEGIIDAATLLLFRQMRGKGHEVRYDEGASILFGEALHGIHASHREPFLREEFQTATTADAYMRAEAPHLSDDSEDDIRVRHAFHTNLQWHLPATLRRIEGMAQTTGLTVHMPYLDAALVQFMYNVPWALKQSLPEVLLPRKRSPFPSTQNPAFLKKMQHMLQALNDAPVFELVDRERTLQEADAPTLAYFLQLNYWLEHFTIDIYV
ncbi:MAG: asparagine synthase-related protein [Defluviitaleaceae bacterium]|nr:asparagine synthase-related protein [Defluviitaleaceae bacterium]MCL2274200.1 asparagine synthase-related protein [Defluviitaleaceae bacterium]